VNESSLPNTSDRRTRVTIVVSQLFPLLGLESATVSLVEALARNHNVRVVVIADKASAVLVHTPVTVESWGGKVAGWKRLFTVLRAFRHRNDLDDSVIILSGAWAAIPMLLALPKRSLPRTLVWEHSFDNEKIRANRRLAVLRAVARPLYARACATISVSESLRRDMRGAGFGGIIEVIPNIIRELDSGHTKEVIPGRLLTIGSLKKTKNQSLALRTLALLPKHFSLDVLGDGPERSMLERLAVELGIANRVYFYGYLPNPAEHFARSEYVIHPSLGETYGLVLFEASSFRKPVVAANQSVMAELIPQLVPGLVAAPQPRAFASAIRSLEATPVTEQDFAEAAHRRELVSQDIVRDWQRLICSAS
jgi:glycosyltransferase involved in cell wall biosynthesis